MNQQNPTLKKSLLAIGITASVGISTSAMASSYEVTDRTSLDLSGKIVGALIADSDVSGMGVNNTANGPFGKNDDSNIAIDSTLTRLNFGTNTELEGDESIKSFVSFDFNGANDGKMSLRMREAYVNWRIGNGSLLVGQTWSTLMDMNRMPDTVLEPTLSGVVFTRQPMIRWSQTFGSFRYDIALESGSNRVQTEDDQTVLDNTSDYPDLIVALQTNTEDYWVRASGVVNQITTKDTHKNQTVDDMGWGYQLSGGIKFDEKNHFSLAYFNSYGNDRYVLGVSGTGPIYNPKTDDFQIRESEAMWGSISHSWTPSLKSTLAYGMWQADELEGQADTFTSTQFAVANLKWTVRENLIAGFEYNYTTYDRSASDSRDNHRLILAIDYQF
ncbi:porin [Vibrio diabolicus]|uniref:porin n=1 Tax=Vibrio diabolicus TaxID=50719 RepID=UPI0021752314|nr:porin [Vibrio diabolicus]